MKYQIRFNYIRKFTFNFLKAFLIFAFLLFTSIPGAFAQVIDTQSGSASVSATVGQYYLDISGYIAPFASVVLIVDNIPLRATTADANGYFYITSVLINKGFDHFCLDGVDYKRYGESYTCLNVPPATQDLKLTGIFLPPTLGFERSEINLGDTAIIRGYTMRGAVATIYLSNGQSFNITADNQGYYELQVKLNSAGNYSIYAQANYQSAISLKPTRQNQLIVLSFSQQVNKTIGQKLQDFLRFLLGNPWGVVLFILPIIILIFILLKKLKPEWFTSIDRDFARMGHYLPFMRHKLHHWWWMGY